MMLGCGTPETVDRAEIPSREASSGVAGVVTNTACRPWIEASGAPTARTSTEVASPDQYGAATRLSLLASGPSPPSSASRSTHDDQSPAPLRVRPCSFTPSERDCHSAPNRWKTGPPARSACANTTVPGGAPGDADRAAKPVAGTVATVGVTGWRSLGAGSFGAAADWVTPATTNAPVKAKAVRVDASLVILPLIGAVPCVDPVARPSPRRIAKPQYAKFVTDVKTGVHLHLAQDRTHTSPQRLHQIRCQADPVADRARPR